MDDDVCELAVGDEVEIMDELWMYSTYIKFIEAYAPKYIKQFDECAPKRKHRAHTSFIVIALHDHTLRADEKLAIIRTHNSREVYVMGIKGLNRIEPIDRNVLTNIGGF